MPRDHDDREDELPRRQRRRDDDEFDDERLRRRRRTQNDDDYEPNSRNRGRNLDKDNRERGWARSATFVGAFSLVKGCLALIVSFMPCVGAIAIFPGILGLFLGIMGVVFAKKSNGRAGKGLAIAGICLNSGAIVISLVWILFMGSVSSRDTELDEQETEAVRNAQVVRVSPDNLVKQYETNEPKTKNDYTGQVLEMTGKVTWLDLEGKPYVIINAPNGWGIGCNFTSNAEKSELRGIRLKKGDTVTIRGRCVKITLQNVNLENCVLVK